MKKLTRKQLNDKIYFDLIDDVTNYDHSMPMAMLLIEYAINNIPFTWLHWCLISTVQYSYILYQWFYSVNISHVLVYDFMNWFKEPMKAMLIGSFTILVSTVMTLIVVNVTKCKIRIATGINISKEL